MRFPPAILGLSFACGIYLPAAAQAAVRGSNAGGAAPGFVGDLLNDARIGLSLLRRQLEQPAPGIGDVLRLLLALTLAYVLVGPSRRWAIARVSAFLTKRRKNVDLVIFGRAIVTVFISLLCFSMASALALKGVRSCLALLPETRALFGAMMGGCVISGLGLGIGLALRSPDAKHLRPLRLPPGLGRAIGTYPFAAGVLLGAVAFVDLASRELHASASSWGMAQACVALAQLLLIGRFLVLAGQARERSSIAEADVEGPSLPAIFGATAVVWVVVAVAAGALALGHARFAMTALQEILWASLVLTTAWIVTRFFDALVVGLLSQNQRTNRFATGVMGVNKSRIDQAALLVSALVNVVVWLLAILLAVAPLHGGGDNVVEQVRPRPVLASLRTIDLTPGTILSAVMILAVGVAVTRMIRRWLENRFLPATSLDVGARASITTGLGYVGVVIALIGASSALGLQLEKITLLVSALTVGIGFGLQAIIQNFVSGVIMLFERPVKVGDRVIVSGSEGRIRRMRVRATEIVADDGSVAIIPNSAFVSSTVVNRSEAVVPSELAVKVIVDGMRTAREAMNLLKEILNVHVEGISASSKCIQLEKIGKDEFIFQLRVQLALDQAKPDARGRLLMELSERAPQGVVLITD